MDTQRKKGFYTFRIAGILLLASAAYELISITAAVPLFGAVRGGISAALYHLIYVTLFAALGIGLWRAKPWGYTLVFVTTAVYTLDKAQLLLGRAALEAHLRSMLAGMEGQLQAQGLDIAYLVQGIVLISLVVVLCWWGFALYTYWRREYFQSDLKHARQM